MALRAALLIELKVVTMVLRAALLIELKSCNYGATRSALIKKIILT
jgi:hypothetical protein